MTRIVILTAVLVMCLACSDNENIDLVVEPVRIKPVNLSAPIIKNIVVPDQVHAGGRVKLEAVAEDPDGNALAYNWDAPGKLIFAKTTSIAIWTAPIDLGVVTVTLSVNDGIHKTTKSSVLRVIHSLIVPGKEVAGIRLGDRHDEVIHLYGEPSKQFKIDADNELAAFFEWDTSLEWNQAGLSVYFRNNRVCELAISAPNSAETAGGNGIDSHRDDFRKELGPNNSGGTSWGRDIKYHSDIWDARGIEIRYYKAKVVQVVIRKKDDS